MELEEARLALDKAKAVCTVDAHYTSELESVIRRSATGRFFARLAPPAMGRRVFDALQAYADGLRTVLLDRPVPARNHHM